MENKKVERCEQYEEYVSKLILCKIYCPLVSFLMIYNSMDSAVYYKCNYEVRCVYCNNATIPCDHDW